MMIIGNPNIEDGRSRPPYTLLVSLAVMSLLVITAASLVYLGHPAPPAVPVVVAITIAPASPPPPAAIAAVQPVKPPAGPVTLPAAQVSAPIPSQVSAPLVQMPPPAMRQPVPLTPVSKPVSVSSSPNPAVRALDPAPDPALIMRGTYGFVPVIGKNDRRAWKVYARPFDISDKRPRVALVVSGLGISASATDAAIREAPGAATLAFVPFARRLEQWMNLARANGHETLMELPMEPIDYPRQDPGFNALLTALTPAQNVDRLGWVMSQGAGYVGLMGRLGGRFSATGDAIKPVLQEIAKHGLLYVDNHSTPQTVAPHLASSAGLPFAGVDHLIDSDPSPAEIDRSLADLEAQAKRTGSAIGAVTAGKATLNRVTEWANGLEARGFVLAPVSAVVVPPDAADKSITP